MDIYKTLMGTSDPDLVRQFNELGDSDSQKKPILEEMAIRMLPYSSLHLPEHQHFHITILCDEKKEYALLQKYKDTGMANSYQIRPFAEKIGTIAMEDTQAFYPTKQYEGSILVEMKRDVSEKVLAVAEPFRSSYREIFTLPNVYEDLALTSRDIAYLLSYLSESSAGAEALKPEFLAAVERAKEQIASEENPGRN